MKIQVYDARRTRWVTVAVEGLVRLELNEHTTFAFSEIGSSSLEVRAADGNLMLMPKSLCCIEISTTPFPSFAPDRLEIDEAEKDSGEGDIGQKK